MAVDDAYTKLLLHFNGDNNGTTFTDEAGHTITKSGTVVLDTSVKNLGTASAHMSGGWLTCDSSDLYITTGKFTFDMWIRFVSSDPTGQFFSYGGSNSGLLLFHSSKNIGLYSDGNRILSSGSAYGYDTWYHVALVGNGGADGSRNIKLYVSGTLIGTWTTNYNYSKTVMIGANEASTGENCHGYYDEVRVSIGVERWTAAFTPPTAEYSAITYKSSGTATFGPFALPELSADPTSSSVDWTATVPDDTSLTIKTAIVSGTPTDSDYETVTNGGEIPSLDVDSSELDLYIKAYLATDDDAVTPSLSALSFLIVKAGDPLKLQINLTGAGRLMAPQDNVAVIYTKALGGLSGPLSALVEDFETDFEADNITLMWDPNNVEHLSAQAGISLAVTDIVYIYNQSGDEHLSAQAGMTLAVTKVGDLPL